MRWVVKRTLKAILTIYAAITLTFFLIRAMPANPIDRAMQEYRRQGLPEYEARQMAAAIFASFDISKPILDQYVSYILGLLRGDLGRSIHWLNVPIVEIMAYAIPWTVFIVSLSLVASFLVGIVLGMAMAYLRGSVFDSIMTGICTVCNAIPNYILALFLLFYLAFATGWFPAYGAYDINIQPGFTWEFISNVLQHAVLPFLAFFITSFGGWSLAMRGSTVSTLGEDYVEAAEARGLPRRRIMLSYVGRNAILPLFTSFAISLGFIFGGSTLIETIFSYPGIGWYLNMSINRRDYVLMQGFFLIITLAVVFSNYIADMLYGKLDPRIKME
ncbi:MAG: ABC transporter permease [Candidatus Bathyarchaeia archaeon]